MHKKFLSFLALLLLSAPLLVSAKTDLSISQTDLTFSKDAPLAGDDITIYARVFNLGDSDVSGFVDFLDNGKEMATPQSISLRPNTYDDVFIGWKAVAGIQNIQAKIIQTNLKDDNPQNNITIQKELFVDLDTNQNGIGDSKEQPITIAPVSNEVASEATTSPLPENVQQMLIDSQNANPIKSAIESINQALTSQAKNFYSLALGETGSRGINTAALTQTASTWGASLRDSLDWLYASQNRNYLYLGLVALALLLILFLVWKKGRNQGI